VSEPTTAVGEWLDVRVLEQVEKLHAQSPEAASQVMALLTDRVKQRAEMELHSFRHRARLEWAWFAFRVLMAVFGFAGLVVYAVIAGQLIQAGGSAQAGIFLGGGAASVVAIFVTGRAASPLFSRRDREHHSDNSP
jgi:hypothetical protein